MMTKRVGDVRADHRSTSTARGLGKWLVPKATATIDRQAEPAQWVAALQRA
jgi:hypothetical protein